MDPCPNCGKPADLCVCATLHAHDNKTHVFLLQHPQEPDKDLGTAQLCHLILRNSTLKTGFSVPNLKKALGFDPDLTRWAVLFLGSKYKFRQIARRPDRSDIYFFDKKGTELAFPVDQIQGIVVLDGTWAQAKALWWRNPWLLKLKRAVINPRRTSLYGNLRREPRREALSTLESVAYTLEILGEDPAVTEELFTAFQNLLTAYKARKHQPASPKDPGVPPG